jgi:predicted peptidase
MIARKSYRVESYRSPSLHARREYALHLPPIAHRRTNPILFLHSSRECGDDIGRAANIGPIRWARSISLPYVVITPQLPAMFDDGDLEWIRFVDDVDTILTDVAARYGIHTGAAYLTGLSMGGRGAWNYAALHVRKWLAIAAFSGGCRKTTDSEEVARMIGDVPCWTFVNNHESFAPLVEETKAMVAAMERYGSSRYTSFDRIKPGHDYWSDAYRGFALGSVMEGRMVKAQSIYDWFRDPRAREFT